MFNWADYVALADQLSRQAGEAELRAATSRAYYGAFCSARNKLGTKPPHNRSVHAWVWSQYQGASDVIRQQIGLDGDRLKYARVRADYRDTVRNPQALAAASVARAKNILGLLGQLP